MSALPASLPPDPSSGHHARPARPPRPRTVRDRSPHVRLVQAALDLFPGAVVVEQHPARVASPAEGR